MTKRAKQKVFGHGDAVEIQRETNFHQTWEPATYRSRVTGMRGWHRVELPKGRGRYIDSMSGMEILDPDPHVNPRAHLTHVLLVPTRRIRALNDGIPTIAMKTDMDGKSWPNRDPEAKED